MYIEEGRYPEFYETQGPEALKQLEDEFFYYAVEASDLAVGSKVQVGEIYAMPRYINVPGHKGLYRLEDNGAAISTKFVNIVDSYIGGAVVVHRDVTIEHSDIDDGVEIGPDSSAKVSSIGSDSKIGARVYLDYSHISEEVISDGNEVGDETIIEKTSIGNNSHVSKNSTIKNAQIDARVKLGERVCIGKTLNASREILRTVGKTTFIGEAVSIGYDVKIGEGVSLGDHAKVGQYARLSNGTKIGHQVSLGEASSTGRKARIGSKSKVNDGVHIQKRQYIKPSSIVVSSSQFKHAYVGLDSRQA